jgi:hypothetical protein
MAEPKPTDFFIGVVDFFAILMPGVIAAGLLAKQLGLIPAPPTAIFWVALFVAGYLIGHLLHAVGSILDPLLYDPIFEAEEKLETCYLMNHTRPSRVRAGERIVFAFREYAHRYHPLLAYTRSLVKASPEYANGMAEKVFGPEVLKASEYDPRKSSARPTGMYQWTRTWLRVRSPEATTELDRLEADSKLFRTLGIVLPIAVCQGWQWLGQQGSLVRPAAVVAIFLSLWRYCDLRQKTIRACYLHFVQLQSEPPTVPPTSPAPVTTSQS